MIDPTVTWVAVTAVSTIASSALAWRFGARRARTESELTAAATNRQLATSREVAERRIRELSTQNALWKTSSLAPRDLPVEPVFPDRMAPIEHEALVGMLRGLTLIDDAVIADVTGFARTRETDSGSAAIAAIGGQVEALRVALTKLGAGVAEVRIETFDAVHVAIRPLTGRAEGSMLVARSTSMRASPLALDAVAHVASGGAGSAVTPPVPSMWRGAADCRRPSDGGPESFFDDLEQELVRSKLRAVAFGSRGKPSFSAAADGPTDAVRTATFLALDDFQARAARLLRGAGTARVDVMLHGGGVLRWSSLAPQTTWAILITADDGATSPALVERLSGRLRRGIDASRSGGTLGNAVNGATSHLNGSLL